MAERAEVMPEGSQVVQGRRKWYILGVLCLGLFMSLLDGTIVNIALPTIMKDFHTDISSIEWVMNAYILAMAAMLITFGRTADLFGRRLFFIVGTVTFTAASIVCGLSPNIEVLVAARVIQGFGAAMTLPATLSLVTVVFPREQRGMALGIWGATTGIASAIGPTLGGIITEGSTWRWIFFINVPIGVIAVIGTFLVVYESVDRRTKRSIDYLGVLAISIALFAVTFALVEGQHYGWTSPAILGLFGLTLAGAIVFVLVERTQGNPLMDLSLFRNRTFSVANGVGLITLFGLMGVMFLLTLFLQIVLGFGAVKAGLAMTPMSLMVMLTAPFAGKLSDRIGSRWLIFMGLLAGAGAYYWLGRLTLQTDWGDLIAPMMLSGFGIGLVMAPSTSVVMGSAPLDKAGNASGIVSTMRQLGSVLGISALGAVLQNQLVGNMTGALNKYPIPPATKAQIIEGLNNGMQMQSSVIGGDQAGPFAAQFKQLFNEQFITSLNFTYAVGAGVVLLGALLALFIGNHTQQGDRE